MSEVERLRAERDEARKVARDMSYLLRAANTASAAYVERQARRHLWLKREEVA